MGHLCVQWIKLMVLCISKFSVGYNIIPERATEIPQFQQTPVEDEYRPTYENALPGITDIATPMAKSIPVTQVSQRPVITNVPLPEERYGGTNVK